MKTIWVVHDLENTLVRFVLVPRFSFNMVAEHSLHREKTTAERTKTVDLQERPREPAHLLEDPLVNITNSPLSRTKGRSPLEKDEHPSEGRLEFQGKVLG